MNKIILLYMKNVHHVSSGFQAVWNKENIATYHHCFQNRTGPGGRTVKTGNRDENRFFKPKEPDFLLIP